MRLIKIVYCILLGCVLFWGRTDLGARNLVEMSSELRIDLLLNLRKLRTVALNFPCSPFPECTEQIEGPGVVEMDFVKEYEELKALYQQGMIYFFEKAYFNAYGRFAAVQTKMENALLHLSQGYLERSYVMLRAAIEKKRPADPADKSLSDVLIEYGPGSYRRKVFRQLRDSPHTGRSYNAKERHWVENKYRLAENIRKGYEHIAYAKKARLQAARSTESLDHHLSKKRQVITTDHRKKSINHYFVSINMCRKAKSNAGFIFMLKYPYDNYALQNPFGLTEKDGLVAPHKPSIEDIRMTWSENPYVFLKKLHPVYDLRVPAQFRRDLVDARAEVYNEQINRLVRLNHAKRPESYEQISEQGSQAPGP